MSSEGASAMGEEGDEKSALVPRLRFPEFRGAGEWEAKPLAAIARITQGGTPSTSVPEYWGGSIQWLTPAEMGKEVSPYISKTARAITDEGLRNCSSELLPHDSVILSTRAPIGHLAINSVPMAINQGCRGIVVQTDSNAKFVYYSVGHCRTHLESLGAGNTFKELSGTVLKSFVLPIPPKSEQQKIADCLSSIDELITAETHALAALKTHKKGLMQQLFPREGETVPRLRFPEFREAGEWETVSLQSLLARNPEYGVNAPAAPYSEDRPTYLRITDIDEDGRFLCESKVSVDIVATDDNYLELGDIVLARTGASVGKSYRYRREDGRLVFAGFLIRIRPEPKKVNPIFLANFLTTQQYWGWVGVTSARSGQPGINGTEYASLPVPVPSREANDSGLLEQQRIADCLSSLDDLITAQSQKIDALKTHKKGLMQQLFPVLDEAPG